MWTTLKIPVYQHKKTPHHRCASDGELLLPLIPVINHAPLVVSLAGEHLVPANIDRGVWHTGLV